MRSSRRTPADTATILSTEELLRRRLAAAPRQPAPATSVYDAAYWAGSTVNDYEVLFCDCINENRWIHLTAVFDDDASTFTLYQDDMVVDHTSLPTPILAGDSTLYMGTWNMGQRFLAATLDDFAIWDRALDAGEIATLSQQPPRALTGAPRRSVEKALGLRGDGNPTARRVDRFRDPGVT